MTPDKILIVVLVFAVCISVSEGMGYFILNQKFST